MMMTSLKTIAWRAAVCLATAWFGALPTCAGDDKPGDAAVEDAFVRGSADGQTWTIGTKAVELSFQSKEGQFRLAGFQNKLVQPARQYVTPETAGAPFAIEPLPQLRDDDFLVKTIWEKRLNVHDVVDPAHDNLRLTVKKGDWIGFAVGHAGDYHGTTTRWAVTVDYGDGQRYASTDDVKLDQESVWRYYVNCPGTGPLAPMDSTLQLDLPHAKEMVYVAGEKSPYRAPGNVPIAGPTFLHPAPQYDAVRIWVAPEDGTVSLKGPAQIAEDGFNPVIVKILRIQKTSREAATAAWRQELEKSSQWALSSAAGKKVNAGGRPAVQLDVVLDRPSLRAHLHVLTYPRTSVLRQWVELENTGPAAMTLKQPVPFSCRMDAAQPSSWMHHWMIGANNSVNAGMLQSAPVGEAYHSVIGCEKTFLFMPWMSMQRIKEPSDGMLLMLEYLGRWQLSVDRGPTTSTSLDASINDLGKGEIPPAGRMLLPTVTLGVFRQDFDDMAKRIYDWQYEYLWDNTHHDWFGRMLWAPAWYDKARNLQENWAGRLNMDMTFPDMMRTAGMELLWDDAGWSENPDIWAPSREGPDFAQTLRYLAKTDMKWLLWFCGRPSPGLMDTKVGSWGNFQWRTDGMGPFNYAQNSSWRAQVQRFLDIHPRCSFHTCDGGSAYAHSFDIQRLADINMFSDPGGGPQTNYYQSYFELPDKWMDVMPAFYTAGKYLPDTMRQILTMVPCWDQYVSAGDLEQIRRICQIYHYLTREGVAGRWAYMVHPVIQGDVAFYYAQRISYDRKRACIILKHVAPGPVTIYPRALLDDHQYSVGFDSTQQTTLRTGADLMAKGIKIEKQAPGEIIYLGMPRRPGSGLDKTPPTPPSRALSRRECNIGHSGVGIYWSPGGDDNWTSYYEVRRNGKVLGKVSVGTYYFDHSEGWDPAAEYAVRTVDGDDNMSGWTTSWRIDDEPLVYSALGGLFSQSGRDGWSAEVADDTGSFLPMTWVTPAKNPAGNVSGTPNQPGGAEGYWEGAQTARVGRGWQQASATAQCVRTWTVPQDGMLRIMGRAMKEFYRRGSRTLRVRILQNQQQVWPKEGWAEVKANDLNGCAHNIALKAAKGDIIRFVLDKGQAPDDEILTWMPRIVYEDAKSMNANDSVVRILCGAEQPYTDKLGNVWSADRFFAGGKPVKTAAAIAGAQPTPEAQPLYQAGREGASFTYTIPVSPGLYSLRLKFAEASHSWFFERPFNLEINGRRVLNNFDICQAARAPHRAYEQVFRYLVPDADGKLVLRFTGGWEPSQTSDQAMVQAIEVLPESKPVIRVNCGSSEEHLDWNSFLWAVDSHFQDGEMIRAPQIAAFAAPSTGVNLANASDPPIKQASPTLHDQALYHTARSGKSFSYTFSLPPALYTVHLKFAELWLKEPGKRPMHIEINGRRVWESWDPAVAAGQLNMAADIRVEDIVPDANGQITIRLSAAGDNDAILQGIEID